MKKDEAGRAIRRLARAQNLTVEHETVKHFSGEKMRLWFLADRVGRAPVGFPGGADDEATLNYLRGEAGK